MATIGHFAVGMAAARVAAPRTLPRYRIGSVMTGLGLLSMAPDLDVVAFALGIPYAAPWGHRGAAHSLAFAVLVGIVFAAAARGLGLSGLRVGATAALVWASHGIIDLFTNGGLGIAIGWPITDHRFFAPWRPIPVAPIGVGILSQYGAHVLLTELLIFAPFWLFAVWPRRQSGPAEPHS